MKQKISILFFLLLFAGYSKAQTIHKIDLDSLTEISNLLKKFKEEGTKSMKWQQSTFDIGHLIANKKKQTSGLTQNFLNQNLWYAFYFKNELVFAFQQYHENSRMGSCGDIDIYNYYFIENKKFSSVFHFEEPFECYNHQALGTVEQLLQILK